MIVVGQYLRVFKVSVQWLTLGNGPISMIKYGLICNHRHDRVDSSNRTGDSGQPLKLWIGLCNLMCTHTHIYIYIYLSIYLSIYLYIYIYIHIVYGSHCTPSGVGDWDMYPGRNPLSHETHHCWWIKKRDHGLWFMAIPVWVGSAKLPAEFVTRTFAVQRQHMRTSW